VDLATGVEIPTQGMTPEVYAAHIGISPNEELAAVRYLNRRKIIWHSVRRGHSMIYAVEHRPPRGRPPNASSKMPAGIEPRLYKFFVEISPAAVSIALSTSQMPTGGWTDQPQLQAKLKQSIEVEAANLAAIFRKFVTSHAIMLSEVRGFLWTVFPQVMPVVVKTQPDLLQGSASLEKPSVPVSTRVKANLGEEERVLHYVELAGADGIAAYDVVRKTGGKFKRKRVEDIGDALEDCGLVFKAEARTSTRGRKGLRYFSARFGEPVIGSDGRRLPFLGALDDGTIGKTRAR
jgi:hypothetical protein